MERNLHLTTIDIYKEVLSNKRKRFPNHFFDLQTAREVTIWLIEEKLQWDDEQIKRFLTSNTFINNKLKGMLNKLFNNSTFHALNNAYPGKFHEWELANTPRNFWNLQTAKDATIWLIEEKLHWDDEQIKQNLSHRTFYDNGLKGMISLMFKGSSFKALDNAYPGKFHEWELAKLPNAFLNLQNAKNAIIWLIEEKLHWDDEQVRHSLNKNTFLENGCGGILNILFNGSPFLALNNAYPDKFHEWELANTPRNFWNLQTAKDATIWLIEEKLHWDDEQIRYNFNERIFLDNNLSGMLNLLFNNSPFLALDNAYPSRFNISDFQ